MDAHPLTTLPPPPLKFPRLNNEAKPFRTALILLLLELARFSVLAEPF